MWPLGDRSRGFSTTTEYFQHVVRQDFEQLVRQPNQTLFVVLMTPEGDI